MGRILEMLTLQCLHDSLDVWVKQELGLDKTKMAERFMGAGIRYRTQSHRTTIKIINQNSFLKVFLKEKRLDALAS